MTKEFSNNAYKRIIHFDKNGKILSNRGYIHDNLFFLPNDKLNNEYAEDFLKTIENYTTWLSKQFALHKFNQFSFFLLDEFVEIENIEEKYTLDFDNNIIIIKFPFKLNFTINIDSENFPTSELIEKLTVITEFFMIKMITQLPVNSIWVSNADYKSGVCTIFKNWLLYSFLKENKIEFSNNIPIELIQYEKKHGKENAFKLFANNFYAFNNQSDIFLKKII